MKTPLLIAGLLAASLSTNAHAAAFQNSGGIATIGAEDTLVVKFRKNLSGAAKLKRLMRPHFGRYLPITQDIRDATGDPDIVVFDRRGLRSELYTCTFITYRGKRAMTCD